MATPESVKAAIAKSELRIANPLESLLERIDVKKRFNQTLGAKAPAFLSSVLSLYNTSKNLQAVDPKSILASGMIAATLDLPVNPSLGFAAIVPYKDKAQFQIMWKGLVQLAIRTGLYKTMNTAEVYEGEIQHWNRITGEIEIDPRWKIGGNVIGYVAFFRLLNGFEKYLYMSKEEVAAHGKRYSRAFEKEESQWKQNFDAMAKKTVLKLLLSKYGILSIEMQRAIQADQAVASEIDPENPGLKYEDNTENNLPETVEAETVKQQE